MSGPALRARRLLRWYPRPWRDRYGEEFTEILISDIGDRPHSTRRTLDVARGGLLARLAGRVARGQPAGLIRPAVVLVAALTVLFIGGRHLENNWPGTGGQHALIPSGLAAFIWASTLFVSSYWAHPAMFAALHFDQRAWMALSPFVLAAAVASATLLVRRASISSRVALFEARLGLLACAAMAVLVAGDGAWIARKVRLASWLPIESSVGVINVTIALILLLALAVAVRAALMAIVGLRQADS